MSIRYFFFAVLMAIFLVVAGCGGSGNSDQSDPNGSFRMAMNPSADWEGGRNLAMEIEAEGGEITDALFRWVNEDFNFGATTEVTGTASDGSIELIANFSKVGFNIEVDAEFTGLSWQGSYVVRSVTDGDILEQGELDITKSGTATANVIGHWVGTATHSGGVSPLILDIEQKGHSIGVSGSYDGSDVITGGGIVIGDSVYIDLDVEDGSTVAVRFLSTVGGDGDTMEGVGGFGNSGILPLTMEVERVAKP